MQEELSTSSHSSSAAWRYASVMIALWIVVLVQFTYKFDNPAVSDSRWVVASAVSIIKQRNIDLNEYEPLLKENKYYETDKIDGKIYSRFPIGTTLMTVPFVIISEPFYHVSETVGDRIPMEFDEIVASLIVALTAGVIFLIGETLFDKRRYSFLLALIFAYCTTAWSVASIELLQHGPSMLMLSLALYLILLADKKPKIVQYASLPLAFSYVIRPTNAIPILFLSLYILIKYRPLFWRYLLWSLPVVVPFLIFNLTTYHWIVSPYYSSSRLGLSTFLEALAGNMISPARGLLIFSPVFIFSAIGAVMAWRRSAFHLLDLILAAIIFCHWITISLLSEVWWGGYTFGPRFFTDMVPFLMYFLARFIIYLTQMRRTPQMIVGFFLVLAIGASFFTNMRGATSQPVQAWNSNPHVYGHEERIWDWHDLSFMRGL